ncbi:MAG: carbamoyl phosphate synthase small subunit [Firmicutes bacterium]|nr:carbamoyl phosphate synthase small subunit [Bacillota bacterium]
MKAYLALETGSIFEGEYFGTEGEVVGELVFTTGMTGYLETLTDPSYHGQIVLQTFPLIGNYGVISADFERQTIGPKAYIVKYPCQEPSNFRNEGSLGNFLSHKNIVGMHGIDTRALTKIIRTQGVMNGKILSNMPTETDFDEIKNYQIKNAIAEVSINKVDKIRGVTHIPLRVALLDFGAKRGILGALSDRGCAVWSFPYNTSFAKIMEIKPDGIMLSNGPGDPADHENLPIIETIKRLQDTKIPMFGICLGHQLLALANGHKTEKLKFGHRGANQPVKDTSTGRVYISSQNHGYTVVAANPSFVNVNDGTCEGLEYDTAFSVQFHPEGRGGPLDTTFLFDKFVERMNNYAS